MKELIEENKMRKVIEQFEKKLQKALEFKYRNEDSKIRFCLIRDNILNKWDLLEFYKIYLKSKVYPKERIKKIMHYLFDLKMQLYYLLEIDLGLYNHLIYNRGYNNENIKDFPHIQLTKFCLDQNTILKSRILWERVMNLVYYLETGEEIENRIPGNKSKKKYFFDFILKTKWRFLGHYKKHINWFDEKLRTPETHKLSIFRKYFLKGSDINPDKITSIIGIILNTIWENVLDIVQGRESN